MVVSLFVLVTLFVTFLCCERPIGATEMRRQFEITFHKVNTSMKDPFNIKIQCDQFPFKCLVTCVYVCLRNMCIILFYS